jgi:hypothetical protein
MFAMATHVFQVFSGVFASVSDVCCKCFICFARFIRMLQNQIGCFTCCNGTHPLQPPATAARVSCMRVGNGGGWKQGRERSRARETGATGAPCMRRAREAKGDGDRGVRPHVHVGTRSSGDADVQTGKRGGSRVRADVREMEQQALTSECGRPDASHTLVKYGDTNFVSHNPQI